MINFEQLTGRTDDHIHYLDHQSHCGLHPDIIKDFNELKIALAKENIQLAICSGFRSFEQQEIIWNEKVEGKRPLLDRNENILDPKLLTNEEILSHILNWSTIPGTSRHHWGTDIDLFDLNPYVENKNKLKLENSEYIAGPNSKFNQVMETKFLTQDEFPFFRPYLEEDKRFELWHYSHQKMAQNFRSAYTFKVFKSNIKNSNFYLKDLIEKKLEFYFQYHCV
jgi:hypothetical protein